VVKVFDSGMPSEAYWNSLFDIQAIIDWLDLDSVADPVAEIGCGYGTFTVPVARRAAQRVYAIDLEPEMIRTARQNVANAGLGNVEFRCRDVLDIGTELPSASMGMVLLFNILHSPERTQLLKEAARIARPNGLLAIIHWRKDIHTPRGPSVESRPDRSVILDAVAGLDLTPGGDRILEPFHWGMKLVKGQQVSRFRSVR